MTTTTGTNEPSSSNDDPDMPNSEHSDDSNSSGSDLPQVAETIHDPNQTGSDQPIEEMVHQVQEAADQAGQVDRSHQQRQ